MKGGREGKKEREIGRATITAGFRLGEGLRNKGSGASSTAAD